MDRVFVGYASRNGSTAEVAGVVADQLRSQGATVHLADLAEGPDPTGFDAYVLGSAIHARTWLPEALTWVETHRAQLEHVAVFNVSMTGAEPSKRDVALGYNKAAQALVHCFATGAFGGRYVAERVGGFWRTLFRLAGKRSIDAVDSNAIKTWTTGLMVHLSDR